MSGFVSCSQIFSIQLQHICNNKVLWHLDSEINDLLNGHCLKRVNMFIMNIYLHKYTY